ncbi:MAG: aspartate--tRNA ligase [Oscillospiraceae bacterium]|nr:aspartate--tRNA ligase [Oscillospiraceae bacterium]
MSQSNAWKRTHYCGEIGEADVGAEVVVLGWVQRSRDLGGVVFTQLRDRTGTVQALFCAPAPAGVIEAASSLRNEFVVGVRGEVRRRSPDTVNPNIPTGHLEIAAMEIKVFNKSDTPPIYIEENLNVNEATRFKYRYLDLRRPDMQRGIMLRHRAAKVTRDFFDENGFLEIETPMLTKSTPEGARDYLVPSRVYPGHFFALPQSPQLFKQLLMVAGFDRYMQIVRCFRDEDLRADRQPEFTQIDLEMSFVDSDDIIEVNERYLKRLFHDVIGVDIELPIPRLAYAEAMSRYGSDKPDTRFGMELVDIGHIAAGCGFAVFEGALASGGGVRAINAKGCAGYSRKQLDALAEHARTYGAKGLAWAAMDDQGGVRSPFAKFVADETLKAMLGAVGAEAGDLMLVVAGPDDRVVCESLGQLRLEVARRERLIDGTGYKLLWVTGFPLLERDGETGRWNAVHHPFTAPMDEDVPLLDTDPGRVRAKAYDIVINGMEAGGGSVRINDQALQNKMFGLLGYSPEEAAARFDFLLEAFRYGAPPHGGIAYGLDRLVMILAGLDSIKDVIAFPKGQTSACAMTGAPTPVGADQLVELGVQLGPRG